MTVDIEGNALIEVTEGPPPATSTRSVLLPNTAAGGVVFGPRCKLMGVCAYNSSGSAIAVRLYNGQGITAQEVYVTGMPAGNAQPIWFGDEGIECDGGLYWAAALTATCEVIVWVKPWHGPLR